MNHQFSFSTITSDDVVEAMLELCKKTLKYGEVPHMAHIYSALNVAERYALNRTQIAIDKALENLEPKHD